MCVCVCACVCVCVCMCVRAFVCVHCHSHYCQFFNYFLYKTKFILRLGRLQDVNIIVFFPTSGAEEKLDIEAFKTKIKNSQVGTSPMSVT